MRAPGGLGSRSSLSPFILSSPAGTMAQGALAAVAMFALLPSASAAASFERWAAEHGKAYVSEAVAHEAGSTYAANARFVSETAKRGDASFTLGLHGYADQTGSSGRAWPAWAQPKASHASASLSAADAPVVVAVDWTERGVVAPVVDQGALGSNWAFAVTEALQSSLAIKTGVLVPLSVVQLSECSDQMGWQDYTASPGLCSAESYVSGTCGALSCTPLGIASEWASVEQSEAALRAAVAEGPVYVALNAGTLSFQLYVGGVYNDASCDAAGCAPL